MQQYNIGLEDLKSNFFHFTKKDNLENISREGLIPQLGEIAKYLENTKKVFFVKGLDNLLILFDCWINVYSKIPYLPCFWKIGNIGLKNKHFPKVLIDFYFRYLTGHKINYFYAYKIFDHLLDSCCLLNLDLQENIDFIYNDIDEIKNGKYQKEHLIQLGYSSKYSDLNTVSMDEWNMHTLSDHGVSKEKIKLCYVNRSSNLKEIILFAINNTNLDIKTFCPLLYDYLIKRKLLDNYIIT